MLEHGRCHRKETQTRRSWEERYREETGVIASSKVVVVSFYDGTKQAYGFDSTFNEFGLPTVEDYWSDNGSKSRKTHEYVDGYIGVRSVKPTSALRDLPEVAAFNPETRSGTVGGGNIITYNFTTWDRAGLLMKSAEGTSVRQAEGGQRLRYVTQNCTVDDAQTNLRCELKATIKDGLQKVVGTEAENATFKILRHDVKRRDGSTMYEDVELKATARSNETVEYGPDSELITRTKESVSFDYNQDDKLLKRTTVKSVFGPNDYSQTTSTDEYSYTASGLTKTVSLSDATDVRRFTYTFADGHVE